MKWNKTDTEKYIPAKEYIDTLLIPLSPFQLSNESLIPKQAYQNEVLSVFLSELEKELAGRVLLTPSYHYLSHVSKEDEVSRLNDIIADAKDQPFLHVFMVTTDPSWKKVESKLDGEILWWPGIQSGDIHSKEMHTLIRDQIVQFSELIRSYW